MRNYFYLLLLLITFLNFEIQAQSLHFNIKETSFSTNTNDEFSPVFYNGGIVLCSNQTDNSLISYKNGQSGLFKIFYVTKKDSVNWREPILFANELTSGFNDGPATFNETGTIIYYSRNNSIENSKKNISNPSNKVGIFSAELIDGVWTNIKPFTYNNPLYSLGTPALSQSGDRIYFSSDMPGGFGKMDLYYCDKLNNEWSQPINLGPKVNTPKNESFPFVNKYGKLFFASDGHKGYGGKDLFYTQQIRGNWMVPEHLDSTINSTSDDFGLVTDSLFESGYFSSNRSKSDDIFSFTVEKGEFSTTENMLENNYCFTLYDEQYQPSDTIPVSYQWDFGDGIIRNGTEVKHCFPGPGNYTVKLSIIDQATGKTILKQFDYKVDLESIDHAYFNSYDIGIVDKPMTFDATKSNFKGFSNAEYLWNFGDGYKTGMPVISKKFKKKGDYNIHLGLIAMQDSSGNVIKKSVVKKIRIYDTYEELVLITGKDENSSNKTGFITAPDKKLQTRFYLMNDLSNQQKSKIKEKLNLDGNLTLEFDKNGIAPSSYPLLDHVANILKEDSTIRLQMALHKIKDVSEDKMEISEQWAQELAFYFKNKEISKEAYNSKGFGLSPAELKPFTTLDKTIAGVVEFIFMKTP